MLLAKIQVRFKLVVPLGWASCSSLHMSSLKVLVRVFGLQRSRERL